jgi:hypothetical protein
MLSSDIAGVPAAGIPRHVVPGDWSVMVPVISTCELLLMTAFVSTDVAVRPLP